MSRVHITDTILRDAHQSLIATRLRTEDMLPICPELDKVGYWSLEVWGGATFDSCLRFLKEDPWQRLARLREALPNTRLQMLLRGQNLVGYRHYPDDVVQAFVQQAAAGGIDVFRIFDALNDLRNLRAAIEAVKGADKHAQGAICYTVSPVHNIATFVAQAKELEAMGCDSLVIKDMAGLLTPFATAELVSALVDSVSLPLHLHTHSTAGLASMCHLKAIECGCRHIDTAISAFAGGSSHEPTESMVAALKDTPFDTGLDLELLQMIGFYFRDVRGKYAQFESDYTGVDTRVQLNQVPGGMISNLANQLRDQGALTAMNEVLAEIPRVRRDLGYPPLVTPTSQIVGTQAVLNVLTGERYKNITNEVKLYLEGRYGQPPGSINGSVRQLAIGNTPVIEGRPADLLPEEMERFKQEIGDLAQSEEDVLTYAMFPEIGRTFLQERAAGTLQPEPLNPPPEHGQKGGVPIEFNITRHGETYNVRVSGSGLHPDGQRLFHVYVDGLQEELLLETLSEAPTPQDEATVPGKKTGSRPKATAPGHVTTSMPGTIVEVLVETGQQVAAKEPVLVVEAMKMETEIVAPIGGKVTTLHVAKGDYVTPEERLLEIESNPQ
ncbi:sodium-extruding oxaloacetate decarboxylase subunit alpha [Nitrosococcus wardiae]|uniref:Oxaloacetate decarboxylase subunit alpha n=1 Tax=Nitrosococcus wardiae TaxID=1814290 RepID=A0A4P7BZR4_9GAMM|nr:sodium-extruding oxaloacetate decarboxylase subunit alpha [Nitrosococcus wardiae]QBQ55611.1 oxaloacetate decarboxylase subunit alpha [Nitrosococcus wardiae]